MFDNKGINSYLYSVKKTPLRPPGLAVNLKIKHNKNKQK